MVRDLGQARDLHATVRVIMAENDIFELPSSEAEVRFPRGLGSKDRQGKKDVKPSGEVR